MSSARHAVHRADSLTGLGNRPDFTPSHQQVLPSGITLSTCGKRRKPVSGISFIVTSLLRLWPVSAVPLFFESSTIQAQLSRRIALTATLSDSVRVSH